MSSIRVVARWEAHDILVAMLKESSMSRTLTKDPQLRHWVPDLSNL